MCEAIRLGIGECNKGALNERTAVTRIESDTKFTPDFLKKHQTEDVYILNVKHEQFGTARTARGTNMTTKMERNLEQIEGTPQVQRRIVNFFNSATRPQDLTYPPQPIRGHQGQGQEEVATPHDQKQEPILDPDLSKTIFNRRESFAPLGFRHIRELFEIKEVNWSDILDKLLHYFGHRFYGHWEPSGDTQRPDGSAFSIAHAAMLHTDHVLFLPQFDTTETLLWDLTDPSNPHFEFPSVQPTEYLFCSGHSFLSDGKLLAVGGGGNFISNAIASGWKFDPVARAWSQTAGSMNQPRWYPTAVTLGDNRVMVTCGNTIGETEIYNPSTDSFVPVTLPGTMIPVAKSFPTRYPGFHLLPSGAIFFSRTGWHGGLTPGRNAAYFSFNSLGANSGQWTEMTSDMTFEDRREGMSVMLLHPFLRVMVIGGGGESAGLNAAETIDVSALSPASPWESPVFLPEARTHANAVLLPDSSVFVCGGMSTANSPCRLYNPFTDSWSEMAALPSIKGYHSVALLLPSGKVLVAGGSNTKIDIFSPPYLYRGARPTIASAPGLVHHGQTFDIETPDAEAIVKAVLVRPMAVTHQTDTEQRVIEMTFLHDHTRQNRLVVTAPLGGYPRSLAPQGYYMLFILNRNGVPSVAKWIYLH